MKSLKTYFVSFFILTMTAAGQQATADEIDPFIGKYMGETHDVQNDREVKRDLSVEISKRKNGFRIEWKTTKLKSSGKTSTKEYSIEFDATERDHIYSSAMKANLFGGRQPLDPMKGDPYVWAKIEGKVITVHAMIIAEDGGYEMLSYKRSLVKSGLNLDFTRVKNGVPQRKIMAHLDRVE